MVEKKGKNVRSKRKRKLSQAACQRRNREQNSARIASCETLKKQKKKKGAIRMGLKSWLETILAGREQANVVECPWKGQMQGEKFKKKD